MPGAARTHGVGALVDIVPDIPEYVAKALFLHLGGVVGGTDKALRPLNLFPHRIAGAVQLDNQVQIQPIDISEGFRE